MKLPDSVRRAIRTFVQGFTGVLVLQAAAIAVDVGKGTWDPDIHWLQRVALSALAAGVISLLTFIHNWAEDAGMVPSILKATASSGADPVTVDPIK